MECLEKTGIWNVLVLDEPSGLHVSCKYRWNKRIFIHLPYVRGVLYAVAANFSYKYGVWINVGMGITGNNVEELKGHDEKIYRHTESVKEWNNKQIITEVSQKVRYNPEDYPDSGQKDKPGTKGNHSNPQYTKLGTRLEPSTGHDALAM